MEKTDLMRKLDYLLIRLRADMVDNIKKIVDSGCVDIDTAENNYELPCEIFAAVLKREVDQYTPVSKSGKKEVENIYLFT